MSTILIPILLGVLSVVQNTINRSLGLIHGLSTVVLLNLVLATLVSLAFWICSRYIPGDGASWLTGTIALRDLGVWHFLPGIFGFLIVLGLPFAINELGASRVFVGFVVAQILTSFMWDILVDRAPVVTTRVIGGILTIAGLFLVSVR